MLSKYLQAIIMTLSLGVVTGLASAQTNDKHNGQEKSLSLQQALIRATQDHPSLKAYQFKITAYQQKVSQASLSPMTNLDLRLEDGLGNGRYKDLNNAQLSVGIGWLLEGDIRDNTRALADTSLQAVKIELDSLKVNIAAETAGLYLSALAYQVRMEMAKESLDLAMRSLKIIKKKALLGRSATAELARSEALVAQSELIYEDYEHELLSAYRLLAAQWGATNFDFSKLSGDIYQLPNLVSYEELKVSLKNNPAFIQQQMQLMIKQSELKLAKSEAQPSWEFNVGIKHYQLNDEQALMTGLRIPLGERSRNKAGIALAQAEIEQSKSEQDRIKLNFETSLFVKHQQYLHSLHQIKTYQETIIPKLQAALDDTRRGYQLGRFSYTEWRGVQAEVLDARTKLLEASVSAQLIIIEIERMTGVSIAQLNKEI